MVVLNKGYLPHFIRDTVLFASIILEIHVFDLFWETGILL